MKFILNRIIKSRKRFNNSETSKKLLIETRVIFIIAIIFCSIYTVISKDPMIFLYCASVPGGIYGATICFYLNKAKIENICKGIERLIMLKINLKDYLPEDVFEQFESEISGLENSLNCKITNTLDETLSKDIEVQNYS